MFFVCFVVNPVRTEPCCTCRPVFLSIYLRRLRAWGFAVPDDLAAAKWRRHSGDLVSLGKGEILVRRS